MSKILGDQWRAVPEEEKLKFKKMSEMLFEDFHVRNPGQYTMKRTNEDGDTAAGGASGVEQDDGVIPLSALMRANFKLTSDSPCSSPNMPEQEEQEEKSAQARSP